MHLSVKPVCGDLAVDLPTVLAGVAFALYKKSYDETEAQVRVPRVRPSFPLIEVQNEENG